MTDAVLHGRTVLVTRPREQSDELVDAIEQAGGSAICFPVIDIQPFAESSIAAKAAQLPSPDITVFISRNAVSHGLQYSGDGMLAAIGPATAAALSASGRVVDIQPQSGFDSESLLRDPALQDVAGKQIRIIRGNAGRDLLAEKLRERGAIVNYLAVYERALPEVSATQVAALESSWRASGMAAAIVMSVESLHNLMRLLPPGCLGQLRDVPLVTPAERVIKEVLGRYPGYRTILAGGPQAADMVAAIFKNNGPTPD